MPGIVGLITKKDPLQARAELASMLNAIRYESFYSSGTWEAENLNIYCGWTALPGSFSDGMPLSNQRGDTRIIFSGEDYSRNHQGKQVCTRCAAGPESAYL